MNTNKIIFLDIDGVLVTRRMLKDVIEWPLCGHLHRFDQECVASLGNVILQTDAKIVISSTWRMGPDSRFQMLVEYMAHEGVYGDIIGRTKRLNTPRGFEIEAWRKENNHAGPYVIIDDDSDFTQEQKHFFVKTDMIDGLTLRKSDEAIRILNGE